ncbi:hypothetical protein GH714_005752 [Hevea brasiliensis]|uniref:Pectinesterase n=1 Tax=Hevea brasiliensis TaxID=3981 RepID=A0A6A6KH75_HEVBR|nr:hypothetical protein GH714_005752 [Hevea brasiliensis]
MSGDDSGSKRRLAIIGVSSFLLVAMVIAVTVGVNFNNDSHNEEDINGKSHKSSSEISASMKAIKALCQPANYKQTCEKSLEKSAGNTTDPKELIKIAFKVAQKEINEAAKKSVTLQELEKDPRAQGALSSCKELMNMSISELQSSFEKVADFDISQLDELMADLRTWLSASITYQETCLDGFENSTSDAGERMKKALNTAMEMSSNGLDIIDGFSSVLTELQIPGISRRLLEDEIPVVGNGDQFAEFPSWVEPGTRRLLSVPASKIKPDLVVAKDGSGDFKTIRAALRSIPKRETNETFVLYIKQGIYNEYVEFNKTLDNLMVMGDGPDKTRITGNKNFIDGINTYHTATVVVLGDNFVARNIGFENSAGAIKHQAVALRVSADFAIFYNCSMDGYQDTLYTHAKRQFYRDCSISGTIDFVFGDAPVVFQNCKFLVRKPLENQQCIVTAQGRKQRRQPSAIIIQNSTITAHPECSL